MPLPLSNDQPASSYTRTLLAALGLIAIYYTLIIIPVGILLRSAKYIGRLVWFWLAATSTSWFLVLFGTLSARKRGTLVTPIRVGLCLSTLVQFGCGVLLLLHELGASLLYPTSVVGRPTPLATALVILPVVVLGCALDRIYVSVTTEVATDKDREDTSPGFFTRVRSWLGLPRHSPSGASSNEAYETDTTVTDEEKAHLLELV